ncbi:urease accessory protein UreF [Lichenibacterium dinghuense]|uniref:urease accessory protein UreF n=1 Tax=Lichenibacterium dinghuense TaxID=2895977 RepID=UPI001F37E107|nr:urease accessory UreF family protein [Lichenibacterium sp. 6Y81]
MRAILAALWQGDSAFPSGGFAFSNGLEGVAALAGPLDRAGLSAVMDAALRHRWATVDRVALLHAFAAEDLDRIAIVDRAVEAATPTEAFRVGSRRNGRALLIAHGRLATPEAAELKAAVAAGRALGHLPVVQGWVWRRCGLDARAAVAASAYTVAAGLANAAVRLGWLGAIDAQGALGDSLDLAADLAREADDPPPLRLSSATPWLDVAATRHARSGLRLFSN